MVLFFARDPPFGINAVNLNVSTAFVKGLKIKNIPSDGLVRFFFWLIPHLGSTQLIPGKF
jgi:hypothetical protein